MFLLSYDMEQPSTRRKFSDVCSQVLTNTNTHTNVILILTWSNRRRAGRTLGSARWQLEGRTSQTWQVLFSLFYGFFLMDFGKRTLATARPYVTDLAYILKSPLFGGFLVNILGL